MEPTYEQMLDRGLEEDLCDWAECDWELDCFWLWGEHQDPSKHYPYPQHHFDGEDSLALRIAIGEYLLQQPE